jgi:opacity protein-like surface antigen
MRLTAVAAVLALGLSSSQALAADPYKRDSDSLPSISDFRYSGLYASIAAGYAFNELTHTSDASFNAGTQGAIAEFRIGADYKFSGGPYFAGVYVQGSYEDASPTDGLWGYGAGLRAGRYFGSTSLYGLVGYEGQHVNSIDADVGKDLNGVQFGLGAEIALTGHVSLRIEGDYVIFDKFDHTDVNENQAKFTTGFVMKF